MIYHVSIGGRSYQVVVDGERILVDGREVRAGIHPVPGTPVRHLVFDGRSAAFAAIPEGDGRWTLLDRGEAVEVEVLDERTRHIRTLVGAAKVQAGGGAVKAPMPGLVARVLVERGQTVAAGMGLVVLEAMKMENELKAPGAGVVETIAAKPGQVVEKGQVLVTLTPLP
jgi:pyruvate carboxylase subunit B